MIAKTFSRKKIPTTHGLRAAFQTRWLMAALVVGMLCLGLGRLAAQTPIEGEDFENVKGQLLGWSATMQPSGEPAVYHPAAAWDTPFVITVENNDAHSGSNALKWAFSAEAPQVLLNFPSLQVSGSEMELRFFVKTQGIDIDGLLAVDEADSTGKRLKSNWAAVKVHPSDTWTEVVWRGPVGSDTARLRVYLAYAKMSPGATVWIDDITVKPVTGN